MYGDKFLRQWLWHCLAKFCTKNYENPSIFVKVIAKKISGTFFLGHGVVRPTRRFIVIHLMQINYCYYYHIVVSIHNIHYTNKCIGDDTKGAARWSTNYIRKTKYTFYVTPIRISLSHYQNSAKNCFPTQNFTKMGNSAAELWPKTTFKTADVRHLEF